MPAQETLGTPTYPCRMTHDKVRLHDKRAPMYNARRGAVAEFRHGLFKTKKTLFFWPMWQASAASLQICIDKSSIVALLATI